MDNIFSLDACSGPRCSTCIILDLLEDQNLLKKYWGCGECSKECTSNKQLCRGLMITFSVFVVKIDADFDFKEENRFLQQF